MYAIRSYYAYIASGILELYVAGALSEKESKEVYELMQKYSEINQEVLAIEEAVVKLTASTSPISNKDILKKIKANLNRITSYNVCYTKLLRKLHSLITDLIYGFSTSCRLVMRL